MRSYTQTHTPILNCSSETSTSHRRPHDDTMSFSCLKRHGIILVCCCCTENLSKRSFENLKQLEIMYLFQSPALLNLRNLSWSELKILWGQVFSRYNWKPPASETPENADSWTSASPDESETLEMGLRTCIINKFPKWLIHTNIWELLY